MLAVNGVVDKDKAESISKPHVSMESLTVIDRSRCKWFAFEAVQEIASKEELLLLLGEQSRENRLEERVLRGPKRSKRF